jgi:hypothetical protein
LYEIEIVIGKHQIHLNAIVRVEETLHQRSNVPAAEQSGSCYSQSAAQRCVTAKVRLTNGIRIVTEQAPSLDGKALSRIGR